MRYAVFTDVHANLEALEAVLAKIDELAKQEPIDQIWFLGDLVGYGPNPNECIVKLRERTDVIIAGNHDWAAVSKIDIEDFSAAARLSAEWTAEQLTEEHRNFLIDLPERLAINECTLVHGSPYGPLWEYLTSEVLAERSFQCFSSRYCFVGHTHIPVIFQQPDTIANTPTLPLGNAEQSEVTSQLHAADEQADTDGDDDDETAEMVAVLPAMQATNGATDSAFIDTTDPLSATSIDDADTTANVLEQSVDNAHDVHVVDSDDLDSSEEIATTEHKDETTGSPIEPATQEQVVLPDEIHDTVIQDYKKIIQTLDEPEEITPEETIASAEDGLNTEIEELLALLGLSQSMIAVTNEMIVPPEGEWKASDGYRAIINPGGVGQPRDGDPRAAFMIYDTERGFTFYRIPYAFEKTQEKIIKAGLPPYLAARLAYGR